jgi:hypothetical protein
VTDPDPRFLALFDLLLGPEAQRLLRDAEERTRREIEEEERRCARVMPIRRGEAR